MLDLFADTPPWQEPLAPGATILRRFAHRHGIASRSNHLTKRRAAGDLHYRLQQRRRAPVGEAPQNGGPRR